MVGLLVISVQLSLLFLFLQVFCSTRSRTQSVYKATFIIGKSMTVRQIKSEQINCFIELSQGENQADVITSSKKK